MADEKITATVQRAGFSPTYAFAIDESTGQRYFVHKKNVSGIGALDWAYVEPGSQVRGTPVQESATRWLLIEVEVLI